MMFGQSYKDCKPINLFRGGDNGAILLAMMMPKSVIGEERIT